MRVSSRASRTDWARVAVPLLSAGAVWEHSWLEEANVIYDAGTWKMWYTGGGPSNNACGYATCSSDPTVPGNWTKYVSNPVLGQGGSGVAGAVSGINVVKVGSTYYAYYYNVTSTSDLFVTTSSDGITWGAPATAISHTQVAWISHWANSFVWNEGGTTWKMLVEGLSTAAGTPWVTAYATSTDGLTWTVQGSGPLTSLAPANTYTGYSGPWLAGGGAKVNGRYQLWYHVNRPSNAGSDIWHAYSTDAQTWTPTGPELLCNHVGTERDQAADPCVVEQGGVTYLFYSAIDNTNSAGVISLATYPSTVANKVLWI